MALAASAYVMLMAYLLTYSLTPVPQVCIMSERGIGKMLAASAYVMLVAYLLFHSLLQVRIVCERGTGKVIAMKKLRKE
jgi:hypothetical protein